MDDSTTNKTILLVDDEQFIQVAYKAGLENAGYRVVAASDGDEALELLRSETPDLIMLDLIMPRIDGFEVLKSIQADPAFANVPVMVMTNLSQPSDEEEARRLGAVDFVVKAEASLNDVLTKVQTLFANQQ